MIAQKSRPLNGAQNGHTPVLPAGGAPTWRQHEPPLVYTAKWMSPDGIEHLLCVRADSLDALLPQVKVVAALIRTAKERQAAAPEQAPQSPPEGWCSTHQVPMKPRHNATGAWWSHKTADGWCRGKE